MALGQSYGKVRARRKSAQKSGKKKSRSVKSQFKKGRQR